MSKVGGETLANAREQRLESAAFHMDEHCTDAVLFLSFILCRMMSLIVTHLEALLLTETVIISVPFMESLLLLAVSSNGKGCLRTVNVK